MFLAALTLNLGMLRYLLGFLLLGMAAILIGIPVLSSRLNNKKKLTEPGKIYIRKDTNRSSDTPPPEGLAAHLAIVEQTAPNADPSIWWTYAKAEMTEAEIAIAEARLARKAPTGG